MKTRATTQSHELMLSGWGNYPVERCYLSRPTSLSVLQTDLLENDLPDFIPRGLGRAYGDSALNQDGGVLSGTRLNRFLAFDERTGVLECEAGVSLAEIIYHLLPRGWFLPTTPGTKFVTVGGAIAADVHGKNHHVDGAFGNFVVGLDLLTGRGEILRCSPTENAEVFWATVGGMGLTGVIVRARIQLKKVESAFCRVDFRRTAHLDETLECFEATNHEYRHSVAWIDCLSSGKSLGRSVVMLANEAMVDDLPERLRPDPLKIPKRRHTSVPFRLPSATLNALTVKLFNTVYYASQAKAHRIVDFEQFFYPLDHILHWNRIYGRRGFVQYQALFPRETSRRGLIEFLQEISSAGAASFLAVVKSSGPSTKGMLSYLFPGHTLALDFPHTGGKLLQLTRKLDDILLKYHGRLYLAKDALASRETLAAMYDRLPEFQRIKAETDPDHRFASSQSRRLGITNSR